MALGLSDCYEFRTGLRHGRSQWVVPILEGGYVWVASSHAFDMGGPLASIPLPGFISFSFRLHLINQLENLLNQSRIDVTCATGIRHGNLE